MFNEALTQPRGTRTGRGFCLARLVVSAGLRLFPGVLLLGASLF